MSVPTMRTYRIVCTETVVETYEIEAMTREQALDKIIIEQPRPVSTKCKVPTLVVTLIERGEKND